VANVELKPVSPASNTPSRPVQDEWGIYDPEQAGLKAVIRKMAASQDDAAATTVTPARVPKHAR
jgi:hypothetical protein